MGGKNYTVSVRQGQTYSEIAQIYGSTTEAVKKANGNEALKSGTNITVPINKNKTEELDNETYAQKKCHYVLFQLQEAQAELDKAQSGSKTEKNIEAKIDKLEDKRLKQMETADLKAKDDMIEITINKDTDTGTLKKLFDIADGAIRNNNKNLKFEIVGKELNAEQHEAPIYGDVELKKGAKIRVPANTINNQKTMADIFKSLF